jgi:hypothetical protein
MSSIYSINGIDPGASLAKKTRFVGARNVAISPLVEKQHYPPFSGGS